MLATTCTLNNNLPSTSLSSSSSSLSSHSSSHSSHHHHHHHHHHHNQQHYQNHHNAHVNHPIDPSQQIQPDSSSSSASLPPPAPPAPPLPPHHTANPSSSSPSSSSQLQLPPQSNQNTYGTGPPPPVPTAYSIANIFHFNSWKLNPNRFKKPKLNEAQPLSLYFHAGNFRRKSQSFFHYFFWKTLQEEDTKTKDHLNVPLLRKKNLKCTISLTFLLPSYILYIFVFIYYIIYICR